jgi:hypothetical protein
LISSGAAGSRFERGPVGYEEEFLLSPASVVQQAAEARNEPRTPVQHIQNLVSRAHEEVMILFRHDTENASG